MLSPTETFQKGFAKVQVQIKNLILTPLRDLSILNSIR